MEQQQTELCVIKVSSPNEQTTLTTAAEIQKQFKVISRSKLKRGTKTKFDLSDPLYFIFFTVKPKGES